MNNPIKYPFERNSYFYGKLLTVRDFESEQQYVNDKRRLLNRLLFGSGIVTGLQVVRVDDKQITVEAGVAIDRYGREIVVPAPRKLQLSTIKGFSNNNYEQDVYVTLSYVEKGKEGVNPVTHSAIVDDKEMKFSRVMEEYAIEVKEQAPNPDDFDDLNLTHSYSVLHEDEQVRVLHIVPRYVQVGTTFEGRVVVEKTVKTPDVTLLFEVNGEECYLPGDAQGKVVFDAFESGSYTLKAGLKPGINGQVLIPAGTAVLTYGDRRIEIPHHDIRHAFELVEGAVEARIERAFYERKFDQVMRPMDQAKNCIYLAKVRLTRVDDVNYTIEEVVPAPFGEYIYNSSLLRKIGSNGIGGVTEGASFGVHAKAAWLKAGEEPSLEASFDRRTQQLHMALGVPAPAKVEERLKVTTGTVDLPLTPAVRHGINPFARPSSHSYSAEIEHGLGLGPVRIELGVEESSENAVADMLDRGDRLFCGDVDVFRESEFDPDTPDVTLGAVVYPKKGTFRVGLRLNQPTDRTSIRLRWWAYQTVDGEVRAAQLQTAYKQIAETDSVTPES